jgi:hypothetical protein
MRMRKRGTDGRHRRHILLRLISMVCVHNMLTSMHAQHAHLLQLRVHKTSFSAKRKHSGRCTCMCTHTHTHTTCYSQGSVRSSFEVSEDFRIRIVHEPEALLEALQTHTVRAHTNVRNYPLYHQNPLTVCVVSICMLPNRQNISSSQMRYK